MKKSAEEAIADALEVAGLKARLISKLHEEFVFEIIEAEIEDTIAVVFNTLLEHERELEEN